MSTIDGNGGPTPEQMGITESTALEQPETQESRLDDDFNINAINTFNNRVAGAEDKKGEKLSIREKLRLLEDAYVLASPAYTAIRESIIKPEDYIGIPSISEHSSNLSWYDFDEDESGEHVFLYRGLATKPIEGDEHLSELACSDKSKEEILTELGGDKEEIMLTASSRTGWYGISPVLHTTRDKGITDNFTWGNGVIVTYKIPKTWILDNFSDVAEGHVGEKEINVFHSLPKEFVDSIEDLQK